MGGDRTGKCYGFSSFFFFDIGPSPENARSRVGVSLRDIVEDQSGFRSHASLLGPGRAGDAACSLTFVHGP